MCKEIMHACGNNLKIGQPKAATAAQPMKQVDLTVKPGRAFRHKLTGQFLAESGQYEFIKHHIDFHDFQLSLLDNNLFRNTKTTQGTFFVSYMLFSLLL